MVEDFPEIDLLRTGELYVNGVPVANVVPRASAITHDSALHDLVHVIKSVNAELDNVADLREKLEDRMAIYMDDDGGRVLLDGYHVDGLDNRYDNHSVRVGNVRELVAILLKRKPETKKMDEKTMTALMAVLERIATALEGGTPTTTKSKAPTAAEKKAAKEAAEVAKAAEEAEAVKVSKDDVLAAMAKAADVGGRGAVIDVLKTFEAAKVSEVPEDKWPDLLAAIEAIEAPESFE